MPDDSSAKFPLFETIVLTMIMVLACLFGVHCTQEANRLERFENRSALVLEADALKFKYIEQIHAEDIDLLQCEILKMQIEASLQKANQELSVIPAKLKLNK